MRGDALYGGSDVKIATRLIPLAPPVFLQGEANPRGHTLTTGPFQVPQKVCSTRSEGRGG
jgi:hypothetical protein